MAGTLIRQGAVRPIGRRQQQEVKTAFDFGVPSQPTQPQVQPVIEQKEAIKEDPFERLQKKLDEMKTKQKEEVQGEPKRETTQEQRPSGGENAPEDWLTPKIYKGSTNF